jgi:thymidylate synthase
LRGDTNIKYLVDNDCHIWDGDCYQAYLKNWKPENPLEELDDPYRLISGTNLVDERPLPKDMFIHCIKTDDEFANKWGDLGKIYGFQWRNWGGWKDTKQTGFLHKTDNGWAVKWSDLHSFANGTEWLITPIQDSDQSLYSDEDEGKKVYYKNITLGYNEKSFCPIQVAKVIDDKFDKYVGGIDQIQNLINDLKTNPDSRRLMVNAWNVGELDSMTLPPCHYGFQVYTRELSELERHDIKEQYGFDCRKLAKPSIKQLDDANIPTRAISLMWNQRSVDTFLGLPFNIASYGLLLEIIAKAVNMVPDQLIGNLGDVHLYSNHIEQANEQIGRELSMEERTELAKGKVVPLIGSKEDSYNEAGIPTRTREPYKLPKLNINSEFWPTESGECGIGAIDAVAVFNNFTNEHFCKCLLEEDIQLYDYKSHPSIKAPLSN